MYVRANPEGKKLDDQGNDIEKVAELILGKQRNGPTGTIKLAFEKKWTRFGDWTAREEPSPSHPKVFPLPPQLGGGIE